MSTRAPGFVLSPGSDFPSFPIHRDYLSSVAVEIGGGSDASNIMPSMRTTGIPAAI